MVSELWADSRQAKKKKKNIDDKLTNNYGENRIELYGVDYRISSENQRDNDSIDTQRALAMKFIKEKGGVLVDEYIEEAESAFHNKAWERDGLVRLLNDVKEGKVNHVVFFKRDRLARDIDSARYVYNILRECGAKLSFTDKSEPPVDLEKLDFATEVIEMMHYASNNHESRKTQIRVSNTMYEIAKSGRITGGQPPLGYELVHIDGDTYFKPIEKFKPTIKLIEDLYLEGLGLRLIARYLNSGEVKGKVKLPSPIEKPITNDKVSSVWNDKNIDTILFNPVFTGHIHHNPNIVEEEPLIVKSKYIEAVRSDELQMRLNNLRKSKITNHNNKKVFTSPFLLSGLLRCGCCGELYATRSSQKKDGTRNSYYACKNRNSVNPNLKCNDSLNFRKSIIEEFVKDKVYKVLDVITSPDVYNISLKLNERKDKLSDVQIESLKEQLSKNNKRLINYMDLLGNLDLSDSNSELLKGIYEKGLIETKKEESEIKSKLEVLESDALSVVEEEIGFELFLKSLEDCRGAFELIPQSKMKQIIDNLFSDVIVDGAGNVILKLRFRIELSQGKVEDESFISNAINGEGIVVQDITGTINEPMFVYNYFNYLTSIKTFIHKHLWSFLISIDEKLTNPSLHEINYSNLKTYRNISQLENSTLNKYFENKTNTNRSTRLMVQNGNSVSKENFYNIMNSFNISLDKFIEFIKSKEDISLNEHVIAESFNSNSNVSGDDYSERLKCSHCGNRFRLFVKYKSNYYRCVKARKDSSNYCDSIGVNEKYLDTYMKNNNIDISKVDYINIKNGIVDYIDFV